MALARRLSRGRFYYGWYIVAVGFVALFMSIEARGVVFSVFLKPMVAELGWTRGQFSSALAAGSLVLGLSGLFIGSFLDRKGAQPVLLMGGLVVGGGLMALSLVGSLWQFYLVRSLIIGLGAACINQLVTSVAIANWFLKKRGRAIAFCSMGLLAADGVMPFLAVFLLASLGWRLSWVALGLLMWATIPPLAVLLVRQHPEDVGLHPDGEAQPDPRPGSSLAGVGGVRLAERTWTRRQALRTWPLWLLTLAFGLSFMVHEGFSLHFYPYMTDLGFSASTAALLVSARAVAAFISRPFWGLVAERYPLRYAGMAVLVLDAFSLLLMLLAPRLAVLFLASLLFGLGLGGHAPVRETMWANFYGRLSLGKVRSLAMPLDFFFAASGPVVAGFLWDATGSYETPFAFFVLAFLLGALLLLLSRPPKARD